MSTRPNQLSQEDANLNPGELYALNPDTVLAGPEQTREMFGIGFSASLRAVIDLGPKTSISGTDPADTLYVLDRGPNPELGVITDTKNFDNATMLMPVADRYVVLTQKWFDFRDSYGSDVIPHQNWGKFSTGQELIVGRKPENELHTLFGTQVSRKHVRLQFGENGVIKVEDLGSTNGTLLRTTLPKELSKYSSGPTEKDTKLVPKGTEKVGLRSLVQKVGGALLDRAAMVEQVSKGLQIGRAESAVKGEDTVLDNPEDRRFGIFDGAGGHANGALASRIASSLTDEIMGNVIAMRMGVSGANSPRLVQDSLVHTLQDVNRIVLDRARGGITTGLVAQIITHNGSDHVVWASIGDSRLYVYSRYKGELKQITIDEILSLEQPHIITNAIGATNMRVNQKGSFRLSDGDELILCSDGITGDTQEESLQPHEIVTAMKSAASSQESAQALMKVSRKYDDKSVLVISR